MNSRLISYCILWNSCSSNNFSLFQIKFKLLQLLSLLFTIFLYCNDSPYKLFFLSLFIVYMCWQWIVFSFFIWISWFPFLLVYTAYMCVYNCWITTTLLEWVINEWEWRNKTFNTCITCLYCLIFVVENFVEFSGHVWFYRISTLGKRF